MSPLSLYFKISFPYLKNLIKPNILSGPYVPIQEFLIRFISSDLFMREKNHTSVFSPTLFKPYLSFFKIKCSLYSPKSLTVWYQK